MGRKLKSIEGIYPAVLDLRVVDAEGPLEEGAEEKIKAFADKLRDFFKR